MRQRLLRELGSNLRDRRQARGLTQEGLAELSGSHRNYIGALERGERNPTVTKLLALCRALQCKPDELLSGLDSPPQASTPRAKRRSSARRS